MTVINNIEIDAINLKRNEMRDAINNNDPIEDKLNVIIVISNPCLYAKRYILAREFIKRMDDNKNINLYIVELAYWDQKFIITDSNNDRHLQLRADYVVWHKENMINLGVRKLLPKEWKAVAWIDADIEFENVHWAEDTLKILNDCRDIVQIFSHSIDMDSNERTMKIYNSAGYQYYRCISEITQHWHPGYAWAITRDAYEKMGGLYEFAILGSGDNIMCLSLLEKGLCAVNELSTQNYKDSISEFQNRVKDLRFGYVPGVIRHYYHGSKKNRNYLERWQILIKHNYGPNMLTRIDTGIIIPNKTFPKELLDDILNYFKERNEDEDLLNS